MSSSFSHIGEYLIQHQLGQGGMGYVYLAKDPQLQRFVAIKVLPSDLANNKKAYARFLAEARTLSQLNHPAIIQIFNFGQLPDGRPYMVMPYMQNGSLADLIQKQKRFSLSQIVSILDPIASALDAAHSKQVLHRDIKPANILFDGQYKPYLADFGIAKRADIGPRLTVDGALIGTPAYMSPEQVKNAPNIDHRVDVYALTVVAFELMTGRIPYQSNSSFTQANMHVLEPIPRPTQINPQLPRLCDEIIARGMAKDRNQRYRAAPELLHYLKQAAKSKAQPALSGRWRKDSPPPQTYPQIRKPTPKPQQTAEPAEPSSLSTMIGVTLMGIAILISLICGLMVLFSGADTNGNSIDTATISISTPNASDSPLLSVATSTLIPFATRTQAPYVGCVWNGNARTITWSDDAVNSEICSTELSWLTNNTRVQVFPDETRTLNRDFACFAEIGFSGSQEVVRIQVLETGAETFQWVETSSLIQCVEPVSATSTVVRTTSEGSSAVTATPAISVNAPDISGSGLLCDEDHLFADSENISFQWTASSMSELSDNGQRLVLMITRNDRVIFSETAFNSNGNGASNWLYPRAVQDLGLGLGDYQWRVDVMNSENLILASSESGCFRIGLKSGSNTDGGDEPGGPEDGDGGDRAP